MKKINDEENFVIVSCIFCKAKGCSICKYAGWLEILGCGMVDPEVFKSVKYDSKIWTGYAFGIGIDRLGMLKYGINDLRAFFETDYRWLNHFGFDPLDVPSSYRGLSR